MAGVEVAEDGVVAAPARDPVLGRPAVTGGQQAGEIRSDEAPEDIAERLLGLIDGFSLHALLNRERLSPERQIALIQREFDRLRPDATTSIKGNTHA